MLYYVAKRSTLPSSPNDYYREHMQQLINSQWDNTTMLQTIEEEQPFASFQFKEPLRDVDFNRFATGQNLKLRQSYLEELRRKVKQDATNYQFQHISGIPYFNGN